MIIVDSDIVIDILRQHPPAVQWVSSVEEGVFLPGFVVMELYQGCHNKQQVESLRKQLLPFGVLWPDEQASQEAIRVYSSAHLTHAMGIMDALIGATAKAFRMPLHSFNAKHFAGFPGLQVIQPYTR